MSVPRTLSLAAGVRAATIDTARGRFATLEAGPVDGHGHLVLIPGWTGSKEDFAPLLPLLAAAGFRATTYDQRGQFETAGKPEDDYSLAGFAADALAVRAAVGSERSHLLGHSFGGLVAQRAALADPAVWLSLALLCTGPAAIARTPSERKPLELLAGALGTVPMAQIHNLRERMAGVQRPPEIAAFLARRFEANCPQSLKAMTQLLLDAPDRIDAVADLGLPCWVGRGRNDDAWPHDVQEQLAKRLGVDVTVIRASAHSPAVENTEETAEALLNFWNRLAR